MSPKENLLRLIDQLPEDRLAELERLAISMMPTANGQSTETAMSFEEAQAYVFTTFDKTLKKLAQ